MKIRIKGNTVRYRLTKPEVVKLFEEGVVEERTEFPNGTLIYSIQKIKGNQLVADFKENTISLYIPKHLLHTWANTEQVGMDATIDLPGGNALYLLLEKDFKCIDGEVHEDQSDYFENPLISC